MIGKAQSRRESGIFIRFALVGGSFSLIYAVVSAAIINWTDIDPFWVSVGLFILCIPFAFQAQRRFAFRVTVLRRYAFLAYALTQVGSIALVSAITRSFITQDFAVDTMVMGLTVGLAAVVSYAIGRLFTFKPSA